VTRESYFEFVGPHNILFEYFKAKCFSFFSVFVFFLLGNPSPSKVDISGIYICNMSLYTDKVE